MTRRWMILAVLIMVALPSVLQGRWIKDEVYLQTDTVGKVEFTSRIWKWNLSVKTVQPATMNPSTLLPRRFPALQ